MTKNIIRKPKVYFYTAFPSIFLWIFIQVFTIYEARNDGLLIIIPIVFFSPFILTFIYLSLLQVNWKIEFNGGKIIYTNWFRKKSVYDINDILVIHKNPNKKGTRKLYLWNKDRKNIYYLKNIY